MSFGKIFDSTFSGSMVGSGANVFAVWSYIIANTRPPGVVEINPVILSAIIGCHKDEIQKSVDFLQAEDPNSRTKDHEGRRLLKIGEFLYRVPTWQKYRDSRNDEERRAYNAEAQRKHRANKTSNKPSMTVIDNKHVSAQAEAEAEAEAEQIQNTPLPPKGGTKGPLQLRAEAIFHRRIDTPLDRAEKKAFREAKKAIEETSEEEWLALERFYAFPQQETCSRKSLATLVNNWNGEIERAKAWKSEPTQRPLYFVAQ